MRFVAVDWSGKEKGAAESLWLAEVRDGRLTELRNGLDREALHGERLLAACEVPFWGRRFPKPGRGWWRSTMSEREAELRALGPPADPAYRIEGTIWRPEARDAGGRWISTSNRR